MIFDFRFGAARRADFAFSGVVRFLVAIIASLQGDGGQARQGVASILSGRLIPATARRGNIDLSSASIFVAPARKGTRFRRGFGREVSIRGLSRPPCYRRSPRQLGSYFLRFFLLALTAGSTAQAAAASISAAVLMAATLGPQVAWESKPAAVLAGAAGPNIA
jgi:hypothetical protein